MMELRMTFFLDAYGDAKANGDSTKAYAARAKIRKWTEQLFNVDVNEVRLTRRGLVER
jgi:hypothetical protein